MNDREALIRSFQEILTLALDRSREQEQPGYLAVIVPDVGDPELLQAATGEELAALIRPRVGSECRVFAFEGRRLGITRAPRYLVTHDGRFPLFAVEEDDALDPTGYLGTAPPPVEAPANPVPDASDDVDEDFFDELDESDDDADPDA